MIDATVADVPLVAAALLLLVVALATTPLARTTVVTAIVIGTSIASVTTTATVATLAIARAAQTLGRNPYLYDLSTERKLMAYSDRDSKDDREDRDRRDNATNGEERKRKIIHHLSVDSTAANSLVAIESPPPQHDDLDVAE